MNKNKEYIYLILREKMENAGFIFEKEQQPHFQNKRDKELKFVHPKLDEKFTNDGYSNRAKKYYIKPLSDDSNSDIGLTTGKTSPLFNLSTFPRPNAIDTYKNSDVNAWVNEVGGQVLDHLLESIRNYLDLTLDDIVESFNTDVMTSLSHSPEERKARLRKAISKPEKLSVKTTIYKRNPDVVAEVLMQANGKCKICDNKAPFKRKKDGTPYLEVHHNKPLSKGGEDTVENSVALCPNCHREQHFG